MKKILEWLGLKKKKKKEKPRRSAEEASVVRREIDRIFDLVNDMCWACEASGDWTPLDDLLKEVDVDKTSSVILLAWLTCSSWARSKLSYRPTFFEKVNEKLKDDPEREAMLVGLE